MKYRIVVHEVIGKTFTVQARNKQEAEKIAKKWIKAGEISSDEQIKSPYIESITTN